LSTQITTDSIPAVVRGRVDSYAARSAGCPLTGALPLAGGGALALGSGFFGSTLAPLVAAATSA